MCESLDANEGGIEDRFDIFYLLQSLSTLRGEDGHALMKKTGKSVPLCHFHPKVQPYGDISVLLPLMEEVIELNNKWKASTKSSHELIRATILDTVQATL